MRLTFIMCASIAACGFAPLAGANTNPPLTFTLDLLAPCTQTGCTGTHPTDISLNVAANAFSFAPGAGNSFVTTLGVNTPVVCDEIASGGTLGPRAGQRLAPTFANNAPGGLLEFNAGGPSIVDLNAVVYDGSLSLVAADYSNYGVTLPSQVVCYQINPVSGGPVAVAAGPYGIFAGGFEAGHFASEPWVSVQTVNSPSTGSQRPSGGQTSTATPVNDLVYVVQIHNPVVGWHMDFGDDANYFGMVNNGGVPGNWCVLTSAQPGPLTSCGTGGPVTTNPNYTVAQGDIQSATNSVYLQVVLAGSSAATSNWSNLSSAFFPAVASVFPPFGTYPQRFDDKVAVASGNNLPTLNIGSIVCNNDTVSTACVIRDQDGNPVPAALTFANTISSNGTMHADPLAYFVDPNGGTTLPGNAAPLSVSNVSCVDPNGILASAIGGGNFTTSPSAQSSKALGFSFASSGSQNFPYVAGTANCTATFSASGSPVLSSTQSFTITMQQSLVGSVTLTAPAGPAAPGASLIYTLAVTNAGTSALTNVVATDSQSDATFTVVSWACTGTGATCPHATGTGNLAETIPTLPAGSSLSYAVTGTVGAIASNPVTQITNAGSISVPGGSCTGGLCSGTASVATVPIISVAMSETPQTYAIVGDPAAYTISLTNQGGTDATGLTLADPSSAGLSFSAWTCAATGSNSTCANPAGVGAINESNLSIGAGGNVTFALTAAVTVPTGNITNTATATGLSGGAVCLNGSCVAQQTLTGP